MNVDMIVAQLREQRDRIEDAIRSLEQIARGSSAARGGSKPGRRMSPEARARIAAGARKRWAEWRRLQKSS